MKKILVITLIALCIIMTPLTCLAAKYEVPMAAVKPTIDGTVNAKEWKGAMTATVDKNAPLSDNGPLDSNIVVENYLMWSEEGLYGAAIAENDPTIGTAKKGNIEIRGDGVQFLLDPMNKKEEVQPFDQAYIFDFYVNEAYWHEHFTYKEIPEDSGILVASKRDGDMWMVEYFIPWKMLRHTGETFEAVEGTEMGFAFLVQDYNDADGTHRMYAMNPGWTLNLYETFTLSSKTAGEAAGGSGTGSTTKIIIGVLIVVIAVAVVLFLMNKSKNKSQTA